MTELMPVRVTEASRITRGAEVVETVRVVEYATAPPPGRLELEGGVEGSPTTRLNTRPDRSGAWLHGGVVEPLDRPALPPGSPAPARPWWRWRR